MVSNDERKAWRIDEEVRRISHIYRETGAEMCGVMSEMCESLVLRTRINDWGENFKREQIVGCDQN